MIAPRVVVAGLALALAAPTATAAVPTAPARVWYRAELAWSYGETLRASGAGDQQTTASTRLALVLRSAAPLPFTRTCTPDPAVRPRRRRLPGSGCPRNGGSGYREQLAFAAPLAGAFGATGVVELVETRRAYRPGEGVPCATLVTRTSQVAEAAASSPLEVGTDRRGGFVDWGLALTGGVLRRDARLAPGATCPARVGRAGIVDVAGTPVPADVLDVPGLRVWQGLPRGAALRPTRHAARLVVGRRFGRPLRFVWDGRQRRGVLTVLSQHVQIALVPCGSGRRPGRCG